MDPGAAPTSPLPPSAAAGGEPEPRDARVVREILRSVGLREGDYEEAAVQKLLVFAYRYAGDVLSEAKVYAAHAGRESSLQADDVRLAIQAKSMFSGEPPRREVMLDMVRSCNEIPLPKSAPPSVSIPLWPYQDMKSRQNYQLYRQMEPALDQVEETEDEDNGNFASQITSPNSSNEQGNNGRNKKSSKAVSSQLNVMASAAAKMYK